MLEHVIKVVERVLARRVRVIGNVDAIQFGLTPGRGKKDALFVVRKMQEEYIAYRDKKKFDKVPRKVMK